MFCGEDMLVFAWWVEVRWETAVMVEDGVLIRMSYIWERV